MKIKFYYHKELFVKIGEYRQIEEAIDILNSDFKYESKKQITELQRYEINEDNNVYYLYAVNVELPEK